MRSVLRYVVVFSALVGAAWAAVTIEIRGRTAYGHVRALRPENALAPALAWVKRPVDTVIDAVKARWLGRKVAEKVALRERPRAEEAPSVQTDSLAEKRVALLRRATEKAGGSAPRASRGTPAPGKNPAGKGRARTRIDEQISTEHQKALDALLARRQSEPR